MEGGVKVLVNLLWVAERGQSVSEIVVGSGSGSTRSAVFVVGRAGLKFWCKQRTSASKTDRCVQQVVNRRRRKKRQKT